MESKWTPSLAIIEIYSIYISHPVACLSNATAKISNQEAAELIRSQKLADFEYIGYQVNNMWWLHNVISSIQILWMNLYVCVSVYIYIKNVQIFIFLLKLRSKLFQDKLISNNWNLNAAILAIKIEKNNREMKVSNVIFILCFFFLLSPPYLYSFVLSIQRQHRMQQPQQLLLIQHQLKNNELKHLKFIDGIRISQMKSHTCKNTKSIWIIVHQWFWMHC